MFLQWVLLVLGLFLLIKGADWLVSGGASLARKFRVSDLAIGLTVVAFGTSAPELVVNIFAAAGGSSDLVFGNVLGSNNFNIFIILGLAGLITPMAVQSTTVWKEIPLSLLAILLLYLLCDNLGGGNTFLLSRVDGLVLLSLFGFFIFYVFRQLRTDPVEGDLPAKQSNLRISMLILFGLGGLIAGGRLVVVNAVAMATVWGVSEKIIGLTIVAAGTSLPELATSIVAAFRHNNDIAVGNIIGSNIFNICLVLGLSALVRPIDYQAGFNTELYLMAGGTVFLFLAMFSGGRRKLDRWEATILLLGFVIYTGYLITGS